jgi:hypothetical protein
MRSPLDTLCAIGEKHGLDAAIAILLFASVALFALVVAILPALGVR